jgi:hypothetical protein
MGYFFSREGQEEVVRDGKFLPLTGELVRQNLEKVGLEDSSPAPGTRS